MVFARNLTKCGNKGKYGREVALLPGPRVQGNHTMGGGGEANTEHDSIYIHTYIYICIIV